MQNQPLFNTRNARQLSPSEIRGSKMWESPKISGPNINPKQWGSYYKDTHIKDPQFIEVARIWWNWTRYRLRVEPWRRSRHQGSSQEPIKLSLPSGPLMRLVLFAPILCNVIRSLQQLSKNNQESAGARTKQHSCPNLGREQPQNRTPNFRTTPACYLKLAGKSLALDCRATQTHTQTCRKR